MNTRPFRSGTTNLAFLIAAVGLVLTASSSVQAQSRLYVDVSASGANNGLTWTNAYNTALGLQSALTYASTHPSVTEIWVADGTYTPAGPGGLRTATFSLINGVSIYGGFLGGETMLEQRVFSAFVATLSGDLNGDDGPGPLDDNGENSFHVVSAVSNNPTAVLDGFTITAGNADGGGNSNHGGGVFIQNGGATFKDCTISYNIAVGRGGGVDIRGNAAGGTVTFRTCAFVGNTAGAETTLGGGALVAGGTGPAITTNLIRCYLALNSATQDGGGIVATGTSFFNAANTYVFQNSTSNDGGGLSVNTSNSVTLTNCEFSSNEAPLTGKNGGAIQHLSGSLTVTNCTITNNTAGANGSGIITSGGALVVKNSILWGNFGMAAAQIAVTAGTPTVSYCMIPLWSGAGTNNLSSDPLFFNPMNNDNRVYANSPAVDSGDNFSVPQDVLDVDEDGNTNEPIPLGLGGIGRFSDNPYVTDAGNGAAPIVDRGGHEVRSFVYLYVDEDGLPGTGYWAGAYSDLQDALNESFAHANTEIWVANGTYPTAQGAGNRNATFQLRNHVEIYGGFAGFEVARRERDPAVNISILTGDLLGDDGPNFANYGENSYHVMTGTGTDATAVVDGVTVTGGNADIIMASNFRGAGLINEPGSPTIRNCIFQDNTGKDGAGIYNSVSSSVIDNCKFLRNSGLNGGGILNVGASVTTVTNCVFEQNTATVKAGGVGNENGVILLRNCVFRGNSSPVGGGFRNDGDATLSDCTFEGNFTTGGLDRGGAVTNDSGSTSLRIFNSRIVGNDALSGGGIYQNGGSMFTAANTQFSGNSASGAGGGIFSWGSSDTITNCSFFQNTAKIEGGGIAYGVGGVASARAGQNAINNCIFWENSDETGTTEQGQIFDGDGIPVVSYSDVQGGWTGPGSNNINLNPKFVDADGTDNVVGTADDDPSLGDDSPCIDAANSLVVPTDGADLDGDANTAERVPFDLAGHARFYDDPVAPNTGVPAAPFPIVDMGAFEFLGDDCNHNGIPDNCDLNCGVTPNGPCAVPGCGMSVDMDMNGLPDECADFTGGCIADTDWSCFNNWEVPGDVYPNNDGPVTYEVTLDGADTVFLDVDVTIDSLTLLNNTLLRVTQTGTEGDLTIATDDGIDNAGTILIANDRFIDLLCGPVVLRDGGTFRKDPASMGHSTAELRCETLSVLGSPSGSLPGGSAILEDSMKILASVDLVLDGSNSGSCAQDGGKTWPVVHGRGDSLIQTTGDLILLGSTEFINNSNTAMSVGGDFNNGIDTPECFDCQQGGIVMNGTSAQTFEVGGEDLGATLGGFDHPTQGHTNFSFGDVFVPDGGPSHGVTFRNTQMNTVGAGPCAEVLYVHTLTLAAGSNVTVDNCKVYYVILENLGATINTVGCGQLLPINQTCVTDAACDDQQVCTYDDCAANFCTHTPVNAGDVNGSGGLSDLDDILCTLDGFGNFANCPNADIAGCGAGGAIDLDDILAVLNAFGGANPCDCSS